jgi:FkbM family methyltransferase
MESDVAELNSIVPEGSNGRAPTRRKSALGDGLVSTRYGMLDLPTGDDQTICRFLSETGEWAWDEATFLALQLQDGARVIDGGAFVGTFGLGIASQKRLDLICAVEANPGLTPRLKANLARNTSAPSVVLTAMLSGPGERPRGGRAQGANLGSASYADGAVGDAIVAAPDSAITLEEIRKEFGDFDLIKLDVEGMELDVLLGDADHFATGKSTIWVECNETRRSLAIVDLVLSWKLDIYYFAFPSHNPQNFGGLREPIFPWAFEAGLLIAPRVDPTLTPELASHGCILRRIGSKSDLEEAMWFTPRWLPSEFAHADAPMLAAAASRAMQGQARSHFLADPESRGRQSVWEQLSATQKGLAAAEELAVDRLLLLESETRLREDAQQRLAKAAAMALARLEELGAAREALVAAEVARERREQDFQALAGELSTIRKGAAWRTLVFAEKNTRWLRRQLRKISRKRG